MQETSFLLNISKTCKNHKFTTLRQNRFIVFRFFFFLWFVRGTPPDARTNLSYVRMGLVSYTYIISQQPQKLQQIRNTKSNAKCFRNCCE